MGFEVVIRRNIGAIFWIEDKIRHIGHEIDDITLGNQKCIGAIPVFNSKAIRIIIEVVVYEIFIIIPNKSKPEPKACTKKYLIAASFSWLWTEFIIKGMNEYKFNSKPIQIVNQLFDDSTINIPRIRVKAKKIDESFKLLIIEARKELNLTL